MLHEQLPTNSLHAFAHLNNIQLNGLEIASIGGDIIDAGTGLKHRSIKTIKDSRIVAYDPSKPLLTVERELVVCAATVEEHAKSDIHLSEVLKAVGNFALSPRGAIMVFLVMRLSTAAGLEIGQRGAWRIPIRYVKFLPSRVSVPTTWTDSERSLLRGTSLYVAVEAKLHTLEQEFEHFQSSTSHIKWCQNAWWDFETLTISDWKLLDSWFRSRVLQFPRLGIGMAPMLDFANHSSKANAYYSVDYNGDVLLLPRENNERGLQEGDEVTINYGGEKSAAEMVFSYGFIDASTTSTLWLALDLKCPADDPLGMAKEAVSKSAPTLRLVDFGEITWMGAFVWLMCVNEEDGLSFRVLQATNGSRKLIVLWENEEVEEIAKLEELLERSALWEVYQLRALALIQERVEEQLFELITSEKELGEHAEIDVGKQEAAVAARLRELEKQLLERAVVSFENQKEKLLETEVVQEYLRSAGAYSGDEDAGSKVVEDEDEDEDDLS